MSEKEKKSDGRNAAAPDPIGSIRIATIECSKESLQSLTGLQVLTTTERKSGALMNDVYEVVPASIDIHNYHRKGNLLILNRGKMGTVEPVYAELDSQAVRFVIGALRKYHHRKETHEELVDYLFNFISRRMTIPDKDMDFGLAVRMMKKGLKVSRAGWEGKDMWLAYEDGRRTGIAGHILGAKGREDFSRENPGVNHVLPFIVMKTVTGQLVPWLASQTDVLSDDWFIV
jgi:hypothetical protein